MSVIFPLQLAPSLPGILSLLTSRHHGSHSSAGCYLVELRRVIGQLGHDRADDSSAGGHQAWLVVPLAAEGQGGGVGGRGVSVGGSSALQGRYTRTE